MAIISKSSLYFFILLVKFRYNYAFRCIFYKIYIVCLGFRKYEIRDTYMFEEDLPISRSRLVKIECYLKVRGEFHEPIYARAISFAREDKTGTRYISPAEKTLRFRALAARARMAEGDTDNKKSQDIK